MWSRVLCGKCETAETSSGGTATVATDRTQQESATHLLGAAGCEHEANGGGLMGGTPHLLETATNVSDLKNSL